MDVVVDSVFVLAPASIETFEILAPNLDSRQEIGSYDIT